MNENYSAFMKLDLSTYLGEWVAICNNQVISHGKIVKEVFSEAKKKCPGKRPFIAKVPGEETMIF